MAARARSVLFTDGGDRARAAPLARRRGGARAVRRRAASGGRAGSRRSCSHARRARRERPRGAPRRSSARWLDARHLLDGDGRLLAGDRDVRAERLARGVPGVELERREVLIHADSRDDAQRARLLGVEPREARDRAGAELVRAIDDELSTGAHDGHGARAEPEADDRRRAGRRRRRRRSARPGCSTRRRAGCGNRARAPPVRRAFGRNGPGPGSSTGRAAPTSSRPVCAATLLTGVHETGPPCCASRTQPVRARVASAAFASPRRSASARRATATRWAANGPSARASTFARRSSIVPPFFASAAGSTRSAARWWTRRRRTPRRCDGRARRGRPSPPRRAPDPRGGDGVVERAHVEVDGLHAVARRVLAERGAERRCEPPVGARMFDVGVPAATGRDRQCDRGEEARRRLLHFSPAGTRRTSLCISASTCVMNARHAAYLSTGIRC